MALKGKGELNQNTLQSADKKTHRKIVAFFFLLCFLIYGKGIGNDYSMDDEYVVFKNAQVQKGIKAIPNIFRTTYVMDGQGSYEYRPVVKAVYAIECQLFGVNPHISHFINILMYALSVSFLYFLLLKLLPQYNYILPFLITTLFLIHPLHSEVVLSLKNRDVILSFTGCLLSLYFYLKYAETRKLYHLFFGAFFMLFAMMSKKDSMTFYAVIPFTLWFLKDVPFKKLGWIFLSFLLPLIGFFVASRHVISKTHRKLLEWENPLFLHTSIWHRIPTGCYSVYFYLKMYLIPHPLIAYYGYNQAPIPTWSSPIVWIVIIGLTGAGYLIVKNFRSNKLPVYGAMYFLITISMFTNILKPVVGIVGERFEFIPSVGLSILAAWGLLKLFKISFEKKEMKWPAFSGSFFMVLGAIMLVFGLLSFARNKAWKNAYTLYAADVQSAPESAHLNTLYAAACIKKIQETPNMSLQEKKKNVEEAVIHYKKSIQLIPNYITSLNNLGMVYYSYYQQPDQSIPYLKKAILLDTNYVEAYFNLASCEGAVKQYDEAEKHFLKAIEIDPNFASGYYALTNMYGMNKQYDKILKVNQQAIDKGLQSEIPYIDIANAYFVTGDTVKAVPYLEKSIEFNADTRSVNSFLAGYFKRQGNMEKANRYYDLLARSTK